MMIIIKPSVCNNTQTSKVMGGMILLLLLLSLMASRSSASLVPTHHTISVMRDYYANGNKSSSILLSQIYDIRGGGGDGEDASSTPYEPSYNYAHPQQQQQQQQQQPPPQLDGAAGLSQTEALASSSNEYANPSYEYRETVEDRIDAWRRQQQVCSLIGDSTCFLFQNTVYMLDLSLMLNAIY